MSDLDLRQAAVDEKRLWIRLTRACNNRCMFCLDSGGLNGRHIPEEEIRRRLVQGRKDGVQRVILSGGEPTTHPNYLDFIRFAHSLGYTWVQTVSNGRMFSYDRFAARAVAYGLNEATLSMHAHTPELFDRLIGVKGSFVQAVRGLDNLLKMKVVVSVDIVLTAINLPYLREIMEFYMARGVMEFDLLYIIPFGRGYDEHFSALFPDEDLVHREMDRALQLVDQEPAPFVWTNRLPIRFLEGREHLFQDPHKLYDEILGERTTFKRLFSTGEQPECLGDRCPHCFIRPFCTAARHYVSLDHNPAVTPAFELDADRCSAIVSGRMAIPEGPIELVHRENMGETRTVTPTLDSILQFRDVTKRNVDNLPPCLGGPVSADPWPPLPDWVLDVDGRPQLERFIKFFIERLYRVKSRRCVTCPLNEQCNGLLVNHARLFGLGSLRPEGISGV